MSTLNLSRSRTAHLSAAHCAYVATAIDRYIAKAAHALRLAREAESRGNRHLAEGLRDAAATFQAMARGLAEQSNTDGELR